MVKCILSHNFYQNSGGEETVFKAEFDLLTSKSNSIFKYSVSNASINSINFFHLLFRTFWSVDTTNDIVRIHKIFRPDLIHSHNTFPLISPSIYWAAHKTNIPIVQTLHNFRVLCPGALLLRNGQICEDCLSLLPWRGGVHGCYRASCAQSLALGGMLIFHRFIGTWRSKVTKYIALTEFCREKFIEGGLPADKIVVKPNFCQTLYSTEEVRNSFRNGALFIGRLSHEKGVATMLKAWDRLSVPLRLVGDGPLSDLATNSENFTIKYVGRLDAIGVAKEMLNASFLVFPSEWYEGFPMTLVEAFSCGLPVIATRLGSMAEIVHDGVTGLHFNPADPDDLAAKVCFLHEHPDLCRQMGWNARQEYEAKYTPERNYEMLMNIYNEAIEEKKKVRSMIKD